MLAICSQEQYYQVNSAARCQAALKHHRPNMPVAISKVNGDSPEFVKLELRTAYGPVFRDVSTKPPRDARPDEIPLIDLSGINGTTAERTRLVEDIRQASENTGFFYIINHGIPQDVIENARKAAMRFFKQSHDEKMKVSKRRSKHFNGYHANGMSKASRTEGGKFECSVNTRWFLTPYS